MWKILGYVGLASLFSVVGSFVGALVGALYLPVKIISMIENIGNGSETEDDEI